MIFLLSMLISHCHALLYQKSRRYSRGVKNGIIGTTRNHCEYILSMYINYYFSIIIIMNKCIYIYICTHIYVYIIYILYYVPGDGVYGRLVYLRPGVASTAQHLVDAKRPVAFVADGESWASSIGLSATETLSICHWFVGWR